MKCCLKCWRILLFFLVLELISTLANAQPNLFYYSFDDQFNSSDYNPAFLTSRQKYTFSIIPMGGTSFGYNNQAEIRNMVSKFLSGVSTDNDYKDVLESMVGQASFHQNIESTLLSFTYQSNIGFLNFRIKENESFSALIGSDIAKFMFKSDMLSVAVDQIQELPAQAMHYREYSLGYSFKSRMNRLSAGIRAKVYFGKSAFNSGISGSIQKESGDYFFRSWGLVNLSFPEGKIINADGTPNVSEISSKTIKYLFNGGNLGLGIDLGIKYRITPNLTFSMSMIDLGKINWKTNLNSKVFNGEYKLPKNSFTNTSTSGEVQTITKTSDNYSYSDSISNIFYLTYDRSAFSSSLPVNIYSGIKYQFNPNFSLSLTDRYIMVKDMSYNSFSVSTNFNVNKKMSLSTGYSVIGDSYINIPMALLFKQDFGQFYIGTDNLVSILAPSLTNFAGASFGVCFYLFKERELFWKPTDKLPFYKPRKIKKNRKDGKILKPYPNY
jgi:hypothetical protein